MLSIYLEERKLNINSDCLWMVKLWVILLLVFRNVSLMFRFSTLSIKRMLLYDYKRNAFIVIRNLSKKQLIQMCVYIYMPIVFIICLSFLCFVNCITTQCFWMRDKTAINCESSESIFCQRWCEHSSPSYLQQIINFLTQSAAPWTAVSFRPIIILFIFTLKPLSLCLNGKK